MSNFLLVCSIVTIIIASLALKDAGIQWWSGVVGIVLAIILGMFGAAEIIADAIRKKK